MPDMWIPHLIASMFSRWLGSNGIPDLGSGDFCELTNLQQLYLNDNLLDEPTVPIDAFACLEELRIL